MTNYYNYFVSKTAYSVDHLCINYDAADLKIVEEFLIKKKGESTTISLKKNSSQHLQLKNLLIKLTEKGKTV